MTEALCESDRCAQEKPSWAKPHPAHVMRTSHCDPKFPPDLHERCPHTFVTHLDKRVVCPCTCHTETVQRPRKGRRR